MGKRELLIAVAFAVVGLVAYIFTAAPARDRRRPSGLGSVVEEWREQATGSTSHATVATHGTIAIGADLEELHLTGFTSVTVRGDARTDVDWTLDVDAPGPDEAAARSRAAAIALTQDNRGTILALGTPPAGQTRRPVVALTLVVPARLRVTVSNASRGTIDGVSGVALETATGPFDLTNIADDIKGSHRNGTLRIEGAEGVRLALVGTQATVRRTRGAVALTCRNGDCAVEDPGGPVEIDGVNSTLRVKGSTARVRLTATSGSVSVTDGRGPLSVETRRAPVTVTLAAAVPTTVVSSDGKIVLELAAPLPIAIDAVAAHGAIDASAVGLAPSVEADTAKLLHTFGDHARVVLRNERGAIVIVKRY